MAVDDSYTVSLLHFDGADESTTFTDESGKTWTAAGNAKIDDAQSKFGGTSGYFDGTGDYISTTSHADFNMSTGVDWTVDFWFYPSSVTGAKTLCHFLNGIGGTCGGLHIYHNGAVLLVDNGLVNSGISAGTLVISTWHHIAVVRASNIIYLYLNGAQIDSEAVQSYGNGDSQAIIGRFCTGGATGDINGYIEEFRVSKEIARWTSNFTPKTVPHGTQESVNYLHTSFRERLDTRPVSSQNQLG